MAVFNLNAIAVELYSTPITWKGDPVGHIGKKDAFFYVVKGECYVRIENESFIIKEGELAFLPEGKMRTYSTINSEFVMYEYNFDFTIDGKRWVDILELDDGRYNVAVDNPEYVEKLYEQSFRREMHKDKMYDVVWYASLSELIKQYVIKRRELDSKFQPFKEVIRYIEDNIANSFRIDELSEIACMQSSYFIKKFKASFGVTPITYINKMKMYKAMSVLASSDCSVEKAGEKVGISDNSYFSKLFRQYCYTTPADYRKMFNKFKNEYMFD